MTCTIKLLFLGEKYEPSNTLLTDVKEMFTIFCQINPEKSIVQKYGLTKGFAQIFQKKYSYDFQILMFISKSFIVTRKNLMNIILMHKWKKWVCALLKRRLNKLSILVKVLFWYFVKLLLIFCWKCEWNVILMKYGIF